MRPCREIAENPDEVPFGAIAHYCWSNDDDSTDEERCGTAGMVIGKMSGRTHAIVQLKTFVPHHRKDATGDIIRVLLTKGSAHHLAQDQEGDQP